MNSIKKLLAEKEAACYISMSVSWLRHERIKGGGPKFIKIKRTVRYIISDLDSWIDSFEKRQNTCEKIRTRNNVN